MKKIVLFALSVVATAAMAVTPAPSVTINGGGTSNQLASISGATVQNQSQGNSDAIQNVASNSGSVTINAKSKQTASIHGGSLVSNFAIGTGTKANQNLASNQGNILIGARSDQLADANNSTVSNTAAGDYALAQQNLSSNFGKVTIGGASSQAAYLYNATVTNFANGAYTHAAQNIASNDGCNADPCQ